MVGLDRVNEIRSRVQANIEVLWVHDHVLDGATDTVHGACDDPHPHASDRLDLRDLTGLDFLVPRIHHLVRLWEVHPKLEAAHAMPVDFRHLLLDDPAPGCHPLVVAGHGNILLVRRFPLKLAPRFANWTSVQIVADHGGTPAWSSPRRLHFSGSASSSPPKGSSGPLGRQLARADGF